MRTSLRFFLAVAGTLLITPAAAQVGAAGGQQAPKSRSVTAVFEGSRAVVFDTAKDSCELIDIPDSPARAFRDYKGTVHLFATHYVARASIGPTLEGVKHDCQVVYNSRIDPNPANFDDHTWLNAFYGVDGRQIVALGHVEYHGWEHPGMCSSKINTACWYNAVTFHVSRDGGYHFESLKPPANYTIGLPYKYEVDRGPEGYSDASNIIKVGEWHYVMGGGWPWPPGCNQDQGAQPCLIRFGEAPIRTSNIFDPSSWRGWSGKDFSVSFADPYRDQLVHPEDHVLTPVPYMFYASGIYFHEVSHLFVAILWDPWNAAYGPQGLYLSTSLDLIHWGKPNLVITQNQLRAGEPSGKWNYGYFSLIDPMSNDPNFSTVTDQPYLYYVRMDDNHPPYVRVLFRQKIKLSWN